MQVTTTSYGQGHLDLATKLSLMNQGIDVDDEVDPDQGRPLKPIDYQAHRPKPTKWAGTHRFASVRDARAAYLEDRSIWRIQFGEDESYYRPKLKKDKWNPIAEKILVERSADYSAAAPGDLFWVRIRDGEYGTKKYLDPPSEFGTVIELQRQMLIESSRIDTVSTDQEFVRVFAT